MPHPDRCFASPSSRFHTEFPPGAYAGRRCVRPGTRIRAPEQQWQPFLPCGPRSGLGRRRARRRLADFVPGADGCGDRRSGRGLPRDRRPHRRRPPRHEHAGLPREGARAREGCGAHGAHSGHRRRRPHRTTVATRSPHWGVVRLGRERGCRRLGLAAPRPRGHARHRLRHRPSSSTGPKTEEFLTVTKRQGTKTGGGTSRPAFTRASAVTAPSPSSTRPGTALRASPSTRSVSSTAAARTSPPTACAGGSRRAAAAGR